VISLSKDYEQLVLIQLPKISETLRAGVKSASLRMSIRSKTCFSK